jgi:glutathione synthase
MKTFGFVMDPLEELKVVPDTSLSLAAEMVRQGHKVLYTTLDGLFLKDKQAFAQWRPLNYKIGDDLLKSQGDVMVAPLSDCDIVFMRKNPPFDEAYLVATYILDYANTHVFNSPAALRAASEKLFVLRWPEITPETWVSRNTEFLLSKVSESDHGWIVKPVGSFGGLGIYKLSEDMFNAEAQLKASTDNGKNYVIMQAFLPGITKGDKRILLLDGEPVGWMNRVPKQGDYIANISRGAKSAPCELEDKDQKIIERIAPELNAAKGLPFVAIDIVDGHLIEVNVTSPAGIKTISRHLGRDLHKDIADYFIAFEDYAEKAA